LQAEDGIRVFHVTGVQTCALPILCNEAAFTECRARGIDFSGTTLAACHFTQTDLAHSRWEAAQLHDGSCGECALEHASFAQASLVKVVFMHADLRVTVLSGAALDKCVFTEGDLRGLALGGQDRKSTR